MSFPGQTASLKVASEILENITELKSFLKGNLNWGQSSVPLSAYEAQHAV